MSTEPQKKVKRYESLALATIMTLGLGLYITSNRSFSIYLAPLLMLLSLAGNLWVLGIEKKIERQHLEVYALLILPLVLYGGLLFFLRQIAYGTMAWLIVSSCLPLFYLLFISLSALEQYRLLPNHVARILLNIFTLLTGYITYALVLQLDLPVFLGVIITFFLSTLIFFQGIFWWSNASLRYSTFYALVASILMSVLYLTLSFWPLSFLITGFSMMLAQYILMGVIQNYFKKNLSLRIVLELVAISILSLFTILSQVNWLPSI